MLDTTVTDSPKNPTNFRIDQSTGVAATDANITASAIWMGLLINAPGTGVAPGGYATVPIRGGVSVLGNDTGLYLQSMPKSAKALDAFNGANTPGGGYAWVVGANGNVYGAYQPGGPGTDWYNGFSGSYP